MNLMKYILVFAVSFLVSRLLLSIDWFTWPACLFVAFYMTVQYWYQMCRSQDCKGINDNLSSKIGSFDISDIKKSLSRINSSIDTLSNLLSDNIEHIRKILSRETK